MRSNKGKGQKFVNVYIVFTFTYAAINHLLSEDASFACVLTLENSRGFQLCCTVDHLQQDSTFHLAPGDAPEQCRL